MKPLIEPPDALKLWRELRWILIRVLIVIAAIVFAAFYWGLPTILRRR